MNSGPTLIHLLGSPKPSTSGIGPFRLPALSGMVRGVRLVFTPHQAKYFAYELTKRCPSDSMEKLAGALADAQVDLNPH